MPKRLARSRFAAAWLTAVFACLCAWPARGLAEPEDGPRPVRRIGGERGPSVQAERAEEAADSARARMQGKLEEARGALQRAREDLRAARTASAEVAREAAQQAGDKIEEAREVGEQAAQQAGAQLQNAGERVRLAAQSLGDRLRAARRAAFQALHGRVNKPSEIPGPARSELRVHARRMAHLQRIRTLAEKAGDKPALERTDKLIAREQSRHREQLAVRLGHAQAVDKPAKPDEDDEPGEGEPGEGEPEREEEEQGAEP